MDAEIVIPEEVAVMTLPDVAFFPQALLPLHIFEPRYRLMLADALAGHRLFAVAQLDARESEERFEPPHRIATVGIVRACQKNDNGTSNLLLQGLCRVEFLGLVREEPYRLMRIRPLASQTDAPAEEIGRLKTRLSRLLALRQQLNGESTTDLNRFLRSIEDPEAFVDIAAFNLCDDAALKQRLLETLDIRERMQLFSRRLHRDIEQIKLRQRLQGSLGDDEIANN